MTILEAVNLKFSYLPGKPVLSISSLALQKGEMAAMIGPNGCGKSTAIRLLAGVLKPLAGEIRYAAIPMTKLTPKEFSRKVSYVPQSISRAFPFSVLEVVLTGRFPHLSRHHFENKTDIQHAMNALDILGVAHLHSRRVTELSGGELQMVSVARALAQTPDCLLLDEPSSSLDLKHRAALIRNLSELRLRTNVAVLMVTHDLSLLEPAFDTVHCLREGELVATDTPAETLRPELLARVYDDPHVCTRRVGGRTFVWSEAS